MKQKYFLYITSDKYRKEAKQKGPGVLWVH